MTDKTPAIEPGPGEAQAADVLTSPLPTTPPRSQWAEVWSQFRHHQGAMAGGIIFLVIVLVVFLGPLIWHIESTYIDIRSRKPGPVSYTHPQLATENRG